MYGAEGKALAIARLRLENALLQQEIEDVHQDRAERRKYSGRIFGLVVGYLLVVGLLALLAGLDQVPFGLPASVLMVLIGSTAVSWSGCSPSWRTTCSPSDHERSAPTPAGIATQSR